MTTARTPAPITVARGDGIGPEIMDATLRILDAAGAALAIEEIEVGASVYAQGITSGIAPDSWESLRRTRVFLKAPITTPQGGGYKSLNVTVRKELGLYANVRPCPTFAPFVATRHPGMDVVIVRENEEDVYAGIEHRQTADVVQCLKLITRPGCERIVRYAFEYARRYGRHTVTCFTKDNIMKATDGLFHQVFDEIAAEYPELAHDHYIVDIGAARLADTPEEFDVVVLSNLYGDILSDVTAQLAGSVGLGVSVNIGDGFAMFEAIHGSAPQIAGQDVANPSGLLLAAVQMLVHLGQGDVATAIHNAWLATIEDGIHTSDIADPGVTRETVGTGAFADAVIARLGAKPNTLAPVRYGVVAEPITVTLPPRPRPVKELVGIDVFVEWLGPVADLASACTSANSAAGDELELVAITNRGQTVWPVGLGETFCVDHWQCRFQAPDGGRVTHATLLALLGRLADAQIEFIKTEGLYTFDGVAGFSLGQGQ